MHTLRRGSLSVTGSDGDCLGADGSCLRGHVLQWPWMQGLRWAWMGMRKLLRVWHSHAYIMAQLSEPNITPSTWCFWTTNINGLVQDCSISIANALEILQSYTEPSICSCNSCFSAFCSEIFLNSNPAIVNSLLSSKCHVTTDLVHCDENKKGQCFAYSLMKIFGFQTKFYRNMFMGVLLTIHRHWFRLWLGTFRKQTLTWMGNVHQDPWQHMASLGHKELITRQCLLFNNIYQEVL